MTERKIRINRRDHSIAPVDAVGDNVETGIGTPTGASFAGRVEIHRQRQGHAADATTDFQHTLGRQQSAEINEVTQKLAANGEEIAIADKVAILRRCRNEPIALDRPGKMLNAFDR